MKRLLRMICRQSWLRYGLRDRVVRFFHDPDVAQDQTFVIKFFGMLYPGNFNTFLDWSVFYYGAYCQEELRCMAEFLEPITSPVVVDIGANIGHHALYAATIAHHVHAFEPYAPVSRKLEEKIQLNRLEEKMTLHEIGLANTNETNSFCPPTTTNTGTGSFVKSEQVGIKIDLKVCKADDYFPACGIARIDYLKMDIEGFEVEALKGMTATLASARPLCFIEWNRDKYQPFERTGERLFPDGYRFYRFVANEPRLVFFNKPRYRLQSLRNEWPDCNFLAVPTEYIQLVNERFPSSKIAKSLNRTKP